MDAANKRIVELEARVAKAEHASKEAWVQVAYHEHLETSFITAIERLKKERDRARARAVDLERVRDEVRAYVERDERVAEAEKLRGERDNLVGEVRRMKGSHEDDRQRLLLELQADVRRRVQAERERDVLKTALERIGEPPDCGCHPIRPLAACQCNSQAALAVWKEEARSMANEALKGGA